MASRRQLSAAEAARQLAPGQSMALLQALHLCTRDGAINADALRKLKQVNHLLALLRPALDALLAAHEAPLLVDAGAGNGYLGFLLHEGVLRPAGRGRLLAIERRADLVERARGRAAELDMTQLAVEQAEVGERWRQPEPLGAHGVLALHACDRATDDALLLGLRERAELIALVPCCQAEVAALLRGKAEAGALSPLWRAGLHRRELGAHLTNVLRVLVLEAHGYVVRVTELVGWEHSLKNELILATRHQRSNPAARRRLRALLEALPPLPMGLLAAEEALGVAASAVDAAEARGGDA